MTPAERWFGVSHEARAQVGLRPLARIVATGLSALFPEIMGSRTLGTPAGDAAPGARLDDPIGTQAPEGNVEAWLRPDGRELMTNTADGVAGIPLTDDVELLVGNGRHVRIH